MAAGFSPRCLLDFFFFALFVPIHHTHRRTHTQKLSVQLVADASPPMQEVFTEMEEKYGEVEEMNVCDNLGDHLVGNVYVKVGHNCEVLTASLFSTPFKAYVCVVCVCVCVYV